MNRREYWLEVWELLKRNKGVLTFIVVMSLFEVALLVVIITGAVKMFK